MSKNATAGGAGPGKKEKYTDEQLQICHRVDRETSGVLLIARTGEAASFLKRAFAARAVKKTYLAPVHGVPAPPAGVIDAPMRLLDTRTHIKMGVTEDGLPDLRERATRSKIIAVELRGGTLWALPGDATAGRADHSSRSP